MTWKREFCTGRRQDGEPCGRKVPTPGPCWQHRGQR